MHARLLTVLLMAVPLAACSRNETAPPTATRGDAPVPQTALGRTVDKAIQEARRELAAGNVTISGGPGHGIQIGGTRISSPRPDLPKAEITPTGDLLIAGTAVAITPQQRTLLLRYRGHVVAIAEAGMALGVRGADLGMKAAGEAIRSVFNGNADGVEARIEAEAAGMEAEAAKLCSHLRPILATQRELAASLPAFAPYATMTQADVDECMRDSEGERRSAVRDRVREQVRGAVRGAVQQAVPGTPGADGAPASADRQDTTPTR